MLSRFPLFRKNGSPDIEAILQSYVEPAKKERGFVFIEPGCDQHSGPAETIVRLANNIICWGKETPRFHCSNFTHFVMGDTYDRNHLRTLLDLLFFGSCKEDKEGNPQRAAVFATIPASSLSFFTEAFKDVPALFDQVIDLDEK